MTPQQIVELRAPVYVGNVRVPNLVLLATDQVGPVFGDKKNLAIALIVLNWLALEGRGSAGAPGAITSEAEGDLSRSYSVGGNFGNDFFTQTKWGLEYLSLQRMMVFGARNRQVR